MASITIVMKNPETNELKQAPVGFSWTILFFWFFVPQLRGDGTSAAKFFIFGLLTGQIYTIYMCFKYNEIYIRGLVEKGFVMVPTLGVDPNLVSAKLGFSLPLEEIEQK